MKKIINPITPLIKVCSKCKIKKVKNHHFLCDECWGKKARHRYWKEKEKIVKQMGKSKKAKKSVSLKSSEMNIDDSIVDKSLESQIDLSL